MAGSLGAGSGGVAALGVGVGWRSAGQMRPRASSQDGWSCSEVPSGSTKQPSMASQPPSSSSWRWSSSSEGRRMLHDSQESRTGDLDHVGRNYLQPVGNEQITSDQAAALPQPLAAGKPQRRVSAQETQGAAKEPSRASTGLLPAARRTRLAERPLGHAPSGRPMVRLAVRPAPLPMVPRSWRDDTLALDRTQSRPIGFEDAGR
jgi:hypothetical protein